MFDTIDLQRFAVSATGALILSTACVVGAVGPAKAATQPTTIEAWQSSVERRIDAAMPMPASVRAGQHAVPQVALSFDAQGRFKGATLRRSSGVAEADAAAVRLARTISYPALPEAYRGQPRTVGMQLYFGAPRRTEEALTMEQQARSLALMAKGDAPKRNRDVALAGL